MPSLSISYNGMYYVDAILDLVPFNICGCRWLVIQYSIITKNLNPTANFFLVINSILINVLSSEIIVEQPRRKRLNVSSRPYTANWQNFKFFYNSSKNRLTLENTNIRKLISYLELNIAKTNLNYPSEAAVTCFG